MLYQLKVRLFYSEVMKASYIAKVRFLYFNELYYYKIDYFNKNCCQNTNRKTTIIVAITKRLQLLDVIKQ